MVEPLSDRSKFWTVPPDWASAELRRDDWSARPVLGLGQVLVSGKIAAAVEALAPRAPETGLWGVVETSPHIVRIARDRALIVSAAELAAGPNRRCTSTRGIGVCGGAGPRETVLGVPQ